MIAFNGPPPKILHKVLHPAGALGISPLDKLIGGDPWDTVFPKAPKAPGLPKGATEKGNQKAEAEAAAEARRRAAAAAQSSGGRSLLGGSATTRKTVLGAN